MICAQIYQKMSHQTFAELSRLT